MTKKANFRLLRSCGLICVLGPGWGILPTGAEVSVPGSGRSTRPFPEETWTQQGFDAAKSIGIFVGVSQFPKDSIMEVAYAVDDAVDLAHLFALDLGLLPPERIVLVLSGEARKKKTRDRRRLLEESGARVMSASRSNLFISLYQETRRADPEGLLIVSISTHGFVDRGTHYLLARDSLGWRLQDTSFKVDYLIDAVTTSPASRGIIFLDACREQLLKTRTAVGMDPRTAVSEALTEEIAKARGFAVLLAAHLGGQAYDDQRRRNGVFTGAVLDGLRCGAAVDPRGFVTVESLVDYVNVEVENWTRLNRPNTANPGTAWELDSTMKHLPLADCGPQPQPGQIRLCSADGAVVQSTCDGKTLTIEIEDFWGHGDAVSFRVLSSRSPAIDIGALRKGTTSRLPLGNGNCVLTVLEIEESCATITLIDNQ